jgi:amidase
MIHDPLGAFCTHAMMLLRGEAGGPLANLAFSAKDNFAVAGFRASGGNPDWLRTHDAATRTAPAVQTLLDAGASLVGKNNMDELAFSLDGVNTHYGTPVNPRAPDRIPGGSSSGSASATAGGLVDFALGTDTVGSVRVPASLCGLFGIRTTHGRISIAGIVPFAPSFDTVGWFAREATLLRHVGDVLLGLAEPRAPTRILVATDLFALADEEIRETLAPAIEFVTRVVGHRETGQICPPGLDAWLATFNTLRGAEVCASLGSWIDEVQPVVAPSIRQRLEQAKAITPAMVSRARVEQTAIRATLDALLGTDGVLILPTVPMLAPRRTSSAEELATYRMRVLPLTVVATIAGLPQVTVPLADVGGVPVGLSLMGARGSDLALLHLVQRIERESPARH